MSAGTISFFLGFIAVRDIGLPAFRDHAFCPICGSYSLPERHRRLGVFVFRDGTMRGPVCMGCAERWAPSLYECLEQPRPVAREWPPSPIGFEMVPIEDVRDVDDVISEGTLSDEQCDDD
jgi:hypothetical protein